MFNKKATKIVDTRILNINMLVHASMKNLCYRQAQGPFDIHFSKSMMYYQATTISKLAFTILPFNYICNCRMINSETNRLDEFINYRS